MYMNDRAMNDKKKKDQLKQTISYNDVSRHY